MQPWQGRIGVIGTGALGGFYGARLARAGADVHLLLRRDYAAVRERGMRIRSVEGDFVVHPPAYDKPARLGPCDLVLVGLKTTGNAALPDLLGPLLGPGTIVLTLQNGLGNEEAIARAIGTPDARERIIGGIAFLCSHRGEPGVFHHTDHGNIKLAEASGPPRERTRAIGALFENAGIRCEVAESLIQIRWEKLLWNIPFNGLGVAARGADTEVVLDDPGLLATARRLMHEVAAAARADGVEIDVARIAATIEATRSMGAYKSSMQVDWEAGRSLEVEAILGEPLRRAHAAGIETPLLGMLEAIVRRCDGRPPA